MVFHLRITTVPYGNICSFCLFFRAQRCFQTSQGLYKIVFIGLLYTIVKGRTLATLFDLCFSKVISRSCPEGQNTCIDDWKKIDFMVKTTTKVTEGSKKWHDSNPVQKTSILGQTFGPSFVPFG